MKRNYFEVTISVIFLTSILWLLRSSPSIDIEIIKSKHLKQSTVNSICDDDGSCLPSANVEQWRSQSYPSVIIIGAKKCGTRALLLMLAAHPSVETVQTEMHHFDSNESYALGNNWYRSQMPVISEGQIVIEKTPSYICTKYVPERVFAFNPNLKLIVILRDPVMRLLSDYTQIQIFRRRNKYAPLPPPGELYINNKTLKLNDETPVRVGLYAQHLERWYKYFPHEQLLVVDGDLLVSGKIGFNLFSAVAVMPFYKPFSGMIEETLLLDPVTVLKEVETFVGLEPHFSQSNVYYNETRGFYCWINGNESKCLGQHKGRTHAQINERERKIMASYYKPYNERLFKMIGKSYNW